MAKFIIVGVCQKKKGGGGVVPRGRRRDEQGDVIGEYKQLVLIHSWAGETCTEPLRRGALTGSHKTHN